MSILQDSADYFYADLWSSKFTWGGDENNIPVEGDAVIVPEGQTLVIDVETPVLKLMVVKGEYKQFHIFFFNKLGGFFSFGIKN